MSKLDGTYQLRLGGGLVRRFSLRFDLYAWCLYSERRQLELQQLSEEEDTNLAEMAWCAHLSHCASKFTRPAVSEKVFIRKFERITQKDYFELIEVISGSRLLGKSVQEHYEAQVGQKKKN